MIKLLIKVILFISKDRSYIFLNQFRYYSYKLNLDLMEEEQTLTPNPKLLALLEKLTRPLDQCNVTLDVGGIFAFPEEWKVADDANPSLFSYKINFEGIEVTEGIKSI